MGTRGKRIVDRSSDSSPSLVCRLIHSTHSIPAHECVSSQRLGSAAPLRRRCLGWRISVSLSRCPSASVCVCVLVCESVCLIHCLLIYQVPSTHLSVHPAICLGVCVCVIWVLHLCFGLTGEHSFFFIITNILQTLLSLSGNLGRLPWVRLQQPQERRYPVLGVHAGSFCVSVIHQTLTWTTGSLTWICDRSYACVYTHGGGAHRQRVSTTFFTRTNSHNFFLLS